MFYERLIAEVKKYPCLYDKKHENYRHKVRKDRAWKEIANSVGEEKVYCQSRWRLLRDRFVKEISKRPTSRWNLLMKLDFLQVHVGSKGNQSHKQQPAPKYENATDESFQYEDDLTFMEYADDDETSPTTQLAESVASYEDYKDPDMAFEEIRILSSPTQSTLEHSMSSMQEEATATATGSVNVSAPSRINGTKRRREVSDVEQHFVSFVDSVQDMIRTKFSANAQQQPVTSRNADFLRVLDGYMLKLNENQQDALKIEVLNFVYNRTIEMKSSATRSQKGT